MDEIQRATIPVRLVVRAVQSPQGVHHYIGAELGRNPTALGPAPVEQSATVLAVHVLHRDEVLALRVAKLIGLRDVLMLHEAGDASLVNEHPYEILVPTQVGEDALHRHHVYPSLVIEGLGPIDLGHAAKGNAVEQVVAAELKRLHRIVNLPALRNVARQTIP
jgi:hypothetical protein